jgi:hypothetical protein
MKADSKLKHHRVQPKHSKHSHDMPVYVAMLIRLNSIIMHHPEYETPATRRDSQLGNSLYDRKAL